MFENLERKFKLCTEKFILYTPKHQVLSFIVYLMGIKYSQYKSYKDSRNCWKMKIYSSFIPENKCVKHKILKNGLPLSKMLSPLFYLNQKNHLKMIKICLFVIGEIKKKESKKVWFILSLLYAITRYQGSSRHLQALFFFK